MSTSRQLGSQSVARPGARLPLLRTVERAGLSAKGPNDLRAWRAVLRPYAVPDWRSAWQLASNVVIVTVSWWLATLAFRRHPVLALVPAVLLSVGLLRCFILFHDCGHGSFSPSRRLNDIVGSLLGVLLFTPFRYWSYAHAVHHATSSDLDRRGVGDVWTMTIDEYAKAPANRRFLYRAYHSPWVLFTLGPLIKFGFIERLVTRPTTTPPQVRRSVPFTNVGIVVYSATMCFIVGVPCFFLVQAASLVLAGAVAIRLFYVQHRFERTYWSRRSNWSFLDAGVRGSSYIRFGPVLRYVTGNIGFHHLHHLEARIPNYNLARCAREHPELRPACVLTLRDVFASRDLKLWDEEAGRYVGFKLIGR